VPGHVCDPLAEPYAEHHDHAAVQRADEAHGHGHAGHAGMSMESMVRDMRNFVLSRPLPAAQMDRGPASRRNGAIARCALPGTPASTHATPMRFRL
jgi:hypothetical protein